MSKKAGSKQPRVLARREVGLYITRMVPVAGGPPIECHEVLP